MIKYILCIILMLVFSVPAYADDIASPSDAGSDVNVIPVDVVAVVSPEERDAGLYDAPVSISVADSMDVEAIADISMDLQNVVVYHGLFGGTEVAVVIPYTAYSNLSVYNGYLVNVGNSSITGRLLYGGIDSFDPSQYDAYTFTIQPVNGSLSSVFSYGSLSYQRHYYRSTSGSYDRLVYDDTYGNFVVTDVDVYYSSSERVYYALLILILMYGGVIVWKIRF